MMTKKQFIRLIAITLMFICLLGSSAMAGWQSDSNGWWYSGTDGSYFQNKWLQEGNDWYYFGSDGYMVTGWQKIDGSWYCFDKSGKMATGWVQSDGIWYYLDNTGAMVTGWREIDGAWYYFDNSGRMYSNAYIDQNYFVGEHGQWEDIIVSGTQAVPGTEEPEEIPSGSQVFVFHQDGWYVARLEVQLWDKASQDYSWVYSDSCCKGQKVSLKIDTGKYEVARVGFQIWYFGWDNFYFNLPWRETNHSTNFTLTGYGDYPKFTWN